MSAQANSRGGYKGRIYYNYILKVVFFSLLFQHYSI